MAGHKQNRRREAGEMRSLMPLRGTV